MNAVEMYLEGKVDIWYQSLKLTRERVAWREVSMLLVKRFEEKGIMDDIELFNKQQHQGSVIEYHKQFENLRALMLVKNPRL